MQVAGGRRNKKQRNREARREAREAQRAAQADREARVQIGSRYDDIRRARDAAREAAELAAVGACMHNGFVPWPMAAVATIETTYSRATVYAHHAYA